MRSGKSFRLRDSVYLETLLAVIAGLGVSGDRGALAPIMVADLLQRSSTLMQLLLRPLLFSPPCGLLQALAFVAAAKPRNLGGGRPSVGLLVGLLVPRCSTRQRVDTRQRRCPCQAGRSGRRRPNDAPRIREYPSPGCETRWSHMSFPKPVIEETAVFEFGLDRSAV